MVKYKVTVARNAYQMLDNHIFFLAKVSTKAAHSLRKTFITTIKSLDYNPERYPLWLPQFELPKPEAMKIISAVLCALFCRLRFWGVLHRIL